MNKYAVGILTALLLYSTSSSSFGLSNSLGLSVDRLVEDPYFNFSETDSGVCHEGDNGTGCLSSMTGFLWEYVDQAGNKGTIKLLERNRVFLTVNDLDNGTWPVKLAGRSSYQCPKFTTEYCTVSLNFNMNVNGENILVEIFEHGGCTGFTSTECGYVRVTLSNLIYNHKYDIHKFIYSNF